MTETIVPFWIYMILPFAFMGAMSVFTYIVPCVVQAMCSPQNLKEKYGDWAIITGGSSGIGAAIADRLASQGVNLVIIALDDEMLASTSTLLTKTYPSIETRTVGVNLAGDTDTIMTKIRDATHDIDIAMVFNNAGYIQPGLFTTHTMKSIMSNVTVNATVTLPITHEFLRQMMRKRTPFGKRSLVCFTSSSGGFMPGPMSSIYASTKAWVSNFGASLAAEVAPDCIDVLVVNPSPIASNFYANASGMSVLEAVEKRAQPPSVIADIITKTAGRFTVIDQGPVSVGTKLFLKMVDWNVVSELMVWVVPTTRDFRVFRRKVDGVVKSQ